MSYLQKSGSPKNTTEGPRLALRLPRDAQGLYTRGEAIWSAIKADTTRFPTTYPPAAEVDADLKALGQALQAAEGGSPSQKAALAVAAKKVRLTLELLGKVVQSVVRAGPVEDAPAIISSVLMYESNVGRRSSKPELAARDGATSGVVQLVARAVASAAAYYWEYSLDRETWTVGAQTAQARSTIAGLRAGQVYYFRLRVLKREGLMTDASSMVSFMVR
jgi:hypothetical protein